MSLDIQTLPSQIDEQSINHQKVVDLVRMWGDLNTDGILDSSCEIFFDPEIEGIIGYRTSFGHAVVFGDPVCAASQKPALAKAFQDHCKSKGLGVVYTVVSQDFAQWMTQNLSAVSIAFGEKLILEPANNPLHKSGSKAGLVRKKVKHALGEGLIVEEYQGANQEIEATIEEVASSWLRGRSGPQIYLAQIALFKNTQGKRWLYAHKNGKIVGVVLLNELKAQNSWLLNNLMLTKEAPNGTSELLVITALEILEKEKSQSVIIGPIPSTKVGSIDGLGKFKTKFISFVYKLLIKLFRLNGQGVFWEKFQPKSETTFLLFPEQNLSYSSIKAILSAYNASLP